MLLTAKSYDAHLYFSPEHAAQAAELYAKAARELAGHATLWPPEWPTEHQKVAFHPRPMFVLGFPDASRAMVLAWVDAHRGGFPVLLHPHTDDPVADHLDHGVWLGEPLELDRDILHRMLKPKP